PFPYTTLFRSPLRFFLGLKSISIGRQPTGAHAPRQYTPTWQRSTFPVAFRERSGSRPGCNRWYPRLREHASLVLCPCAEHIRRRLITFALELRRKVLADQSKRGIA